MKLAASQRPHAPPVPPRPSRQVVAEALKKSARLPCPTRQAPPPPNTRPWRPGDGTKPLNKDITIDNDKLPTNESIKEPIQNSSPHNDVREDFNKKYVQTSDKSQESSRSNDKRSFEKMQKRIQQLNNLSSVNNYENFTINHQGVNHKNSNSNSVNNNIKNNDRQVKNDELEHNNLLNECELRENADSSKQLSGSDSNRLSTQSTVNSQLKTTVLVTINKNDSNVPVNVNKVSPIDTAQSSTVSNSEDCATVVVIDKRNSKIIINNDTSDNDDNKENIHKEDWLEAGIHYSSTKITLAGDNVSVNESENQLENHQSHQHSHDKNKSQSDLNYTSVREKISMASLQGLPPLPRSLSGLYLNEELKENNEPPPPPTRSSSKMPKVGKTVQASNPRRSPPGRQFITLDTQLAILRKEMYGLRQLDLSLLSQLWSLNESIQEFRQLLQDHDDRVPSPSPSSEDGDDVTYGNHPPAPPRRILSLHHHHHHHHRPPRPPRPLRPLPSDESPSSEEYGAV